MLQDAVDHVKPQEEYHAHHSKGMLPHVVNALQEATNLQAPCWVRAYLRSTQHIAVLQDGAWNSDIDAGSPSRH